MIDARRGEVYVQGFDRAVAPASAPALLPLEAARAELARLPKPLVVAVRAEEFADLDDSVILGMDFVDAETLAYLAMDGDPTAQPPTPCYLRAPDARLPS
jgi:tRNA A37 threonylcarbamoyladenosine modification protein TsaB